MPFRGSFLRTIIIATALASIQERAIAQNTVGLTHYEPDMIDGYFLFFPDQQGTVFLVNACGQLVHSWPDTVSVPGNSIRLGNNGTLLRTYVDEAGGNPFFTAGGNGEHVQLKAWDNTVLWDHTISSATECMHHDVELMPNGNMLAIVWELKSTQEAWDAGRDTVGFGFSTLWPEKIVELQPVGLDSVNVVWEWHVWDHLVQDFNPNAANYGVVADHPELVDINAVYTQNINPDWLHINSVDYNPALDQILLSVPFLHEVWVIDHSTTTAEAAGHVGGNSGRGGDLLYRWGNPSIYDRGGPTDRDLFFNHAAAWVGPGLDANDPDVGKIMVFNNRVGSNYSAVDIFAPPVDGNGNYAYVPGTAFGPLDRDARFMTANPPDLYSPGQGSGQKLPNGHVLAASGRQGWMVQLRPDSSQAWSYVVPMEDGIPVDQGTVLGSNTIIFQAEWIAPSDPRLQGLVLDPIGYIETTPNEQFCVLNVGTPPVAGEDLPVVVVADGTRLVVEVARAMEALVIDGSGRTVSRERLAAGRNDLRTVG
ncbi:MAG: aryl-sulfate sulfotransferase, partial [Flavobacteriales bacterium]|nr:aryl-sulfate sulfotransferase [Flavobacteriales bacterium]